ncbi:hypothetical protein OsI_16946 [Oryza sativa Indica Group]|uniref:Uncharacterized protein n=2 Tax=Oryza sativa TaxID=4530 RepID=A2XWB8_ORYSI|nr:hypothetical protein OsI_16946 [Oryza sativa Indica Group]
MAIGHHHPRGAQAQRTRAPPRLVCFGPPLAPPAEALTLRLLILLLLLRQEQNQTCHEGFDNLGVRDEMIFSVSLFGSSHQSIHKLYRKCWSSNSHSTLNVLSLAKTVGQSMRMKRIRVKPHATDLKNRPQAHEDNVFYKLVYRLPENLSWLLASPEMARRPPSKKKLKKEEMVSSNQFGVILEWEGVVVEDDDPDLEPRVWYVLSLEEAKSFPPDAVLKEIEGMRTDQAILEVLHWSEDPQEVQRLAARKEVIYKTLRGRFYQLRPGVLDFLNTLVDFDIPIAITTPRPRLSLEEGIKAVGLQGYFDAIVAAEDFCRGKPEGEMFEVAAGQLGLEPDVCLVLGNSNSTIKSAHTAGMRCVAVASRYPAYELQAANHVVRWLDQLSVADLQRIANGEILGLRGRRSDMDMDMEIVIEE